MKLAVIGTDGCLGSRIVEAFHLGDGPTLCAVISHPSQLARPARFAIDLRVADLLDVDSLARALGGCGAAVLALTNEPSALKPILSVACRAAVKAGLRRLIYVGSADIHGPAPTSGTTEKSRLPTWETAQTWAAAERQFLASCRERQLTGIVLRPGLIYGPRSPMTAQIAFDLQQDHVQLVNDGAGICNCVFVDHVVAAVRLSLRRKIPSGAIFLLTDEETVSWRTFYEAMARELELPFRPTPLTEGVPADADTAREETAPPGGGISHLFERQLCQWKLPATQAVRTLGLEYTVPFAEAIRRSAAWWRFASGDLPITA